jgi:hypothetical protein
MTKRLFYLSLFAGTIWFTGVEAQTSQPTDTTSISVGMNKIISDAGLGHLSASDKAKVVALMGKVYRLSANNSAGCPLSSSASIESAIDGEFEGWNGESIYKLQNGQIWQQSDYSYTYSYAYSPKVLIFKDSGRWKIKVDGVEKIVSVDCIS